MGNFLKDTVIGFCWWDIPALIGLLAVSAYVFLKRRSLRKEKKDLEAQVSAKS